MPDVSTTKKIALGADTIVDYDNLLDETSANATYERLDTPVTVDSSSTPTVDFSSTDRLVVLTEPGQIDLSWSGIPSSAETARSLTLVVTDSDDVAWPAGTRFPGGETPEVTPEAWFVAVARDGAVTVHPSSMEVAA